ncbi:probable serine/threonine-protein kinase PIX13 isoform X1 [Camellia sinensis]|uniref:probable serine/threonine-protein kinase PIX13 isoform X1 n=1 Tax=Camellia sinensis TaxID=4442 RepID=UPI001035D99F|nr:probable serine/threonine-protein kinase PIX13 isoform X1 [Camellia sinensis]
MGICWASPSNNPSPVSTRQFSSTAVGISQTTNNTTSSDETNISGNSQFSAASGSDEIYPNGQILPTPNLRIFSFAELKNATRNFRTDTVLGEGGFGKVYKGWLEEKVISKNGSGSVVAVKKLNSESMQGFQEWQSEVNFLGRLSHPNLVKLLGYCWEDKELLLVYEFMQKGSLENHLFGRGSAVQPLPWDIRLKILIGAAQGLAFLHTSDKQVIYRDFKASNILLDGSYNAKISDFGLAKLGPSASQSHVTTRVMGTSGYAAPEYVATGHLYVKSDVYGFGVVLVEMLTSLRAVDQNRPSGQHNLVDWVKPYLTDRRKLKNIMDSRLEGKYPSKAALQIAQLALNCLGTEPKTRPSMKEVLQTLERIDAGNEKPKEPRINSTRHTANRRGQQRLHHRSPLHPWQDGNQSYQLPPRSS